MKRFLAPFIIVLAGLGLFWYFSRDATPASVSKDVNLGDTMQFTGTVSLRSRPFTGDLVLPEGVFGSKPAFAGYSFRDATRTLHQYDIFLFHRGESQGPGFAAALANAASSNPPGAAQTGWTTDSAGRRVCFLPLPDSPFRYAPGKKVTHRALLFEHRSAPVDVLVIETVVKTDQIGHVVTLPGASPPEKLPEPQVRLEDAAPAFESIVMPS
ncbi:hypothetical protein [Verrucomicrobium sp. BvORR034]|uniref:hypothetical protein n=1 Tax=Verrucomicrobium sp. BvORR034 TaxID=1396418 RepID=UPI000678F505|nr:hypothetical protein [Verrucomicrobium sp. BvORR034]